MTTAADTDTRPTEHGDPHLVRLRRQTRRAADRTKPDAAAGRAAGETPVVYEDGRMEARRVADGRMPGVRPAYDDDKKPDRATGVDRAAGTDQPPGTDRAAGAVRAVVSCGFGPAGRRAPFAEPRPSAARPLAAGTAAVCGRGTRAVGTAADRAARAAARDDTTHDTITSTVAGPGAATEPERP